MVREKQETADSADVGFFLVEMVPLQGKSLAPYMDQPRIFHCREYEARDKFQKHYGQLNTEHDYRVTPATAAQFETQKRLDQRRRNGEVLSSQDVLSALSSVRETEAEPEPELAHV